MSYLYPRLFPRDAEKELRKLERAVARGRDLSRPVFRSNLHPQADWPATGGVPVPGDHLHQLRDRLEECVGTSPCSDHQSRRRFDVEAGLALHGWFDSDGPANAADPDMWPFLTLVVLPDFALLRFPPNSETSGLPRDRFLAGRRNVFYRAYLRARVLGEFLRDPDIELFEDDLVGLIDRNLSMDFRLSRAIAREIAALPKDTGRRSKVRNGLKAIQYEARVTDLACLSEQAQQEVVRSAIQRGG